MSRRASPKIISLSFGILVLLFIIGFYASAQWNPPTQPPSGGNAPVPINTGGGIQSKDGNLALNTANVLANGLVIPFGNVGIGTALPDAKLDVVGEMKIGNSGLVCSATTEGAIRYASGNLELCDGSDWGALGSGGAACPAEQIMYSMTLGPNSGAAICQPNVIDQVNWDWGWSACSASGWSNLVSYADGSQASYVACPWTDTIPVGSTITQIYIDPVNASQYNSSSFADWYMNSTLLLDNDNFGGIGTASCSTPTDFPDPITLTDPGGLKLASSSTCT